MEGDLSSEPSLFMCYFLVITCGVGLLAEQVWRVSAGVYQLRVFNKMFVSAMNGGGGAVLASAASPAQWESFKIHRNPSQSSMVHIQAYNGMYLQVCLHSSKFSAILITCCRQLQIVSEFGVFELLMYT